MIKKLQDAYDCDLDLDDTVGDIFENERDNQMRMVKVVPSFINRMFSMPPTTNLRPGSASKRARESSEERGNKRRRLAAEQREIMHLDPVRDRPLTSTESDRSGESHAEETNAQIQARRDRTTRSRTGNSPVFVDNSQTGNPQFVAQTKEESPELGSDLPSRPIATSINLPFKKPLLPASRLSAAKRASRENLQHRASGAVRVEQGISEHAITESDDTQIGLDPTPSPQEDYEEAAIRESPESTQEELETAASQNAFIGHRANRTTTSPSFMKPRSKLSITYGRSPNARKNVERDLSLLNNSRPRSPSTQNNLNEQSSTQGLRGTKTRLFQVAPLDEIESTPQETAASASGVSVHVEDVDAMEDSGFTNGTSVAEEQVATWGKKGSLKKPKRTSYSMTTTPKMVRGHEAVDVRSNGTAKSASTNSSLVNGTASPLVKGQPGPRRTPVPLPQNVSNFKQTETSQPSQASANNGIPGEPIKLLKRKPQSKTSPPSQRQRRTEVPLPNNIKHIWQSTVTATGDEDEELAAQPVKKPRKPRADKGVKRGRRSNAFVPTATTSSQPDESEPQNSSAAPVPATVSPRKRGRPPKAANKELVVRTPVPSKKRGRPSQGASATPAKSTPMLPSSLGSKSNVPNVTAGDQRPLLRPVSQEVAKSVANKLSASPRMANGNAARSESSGASSSEEFDAQNVDAQNADAEARNGERSAQYDEAEAEAHDVEAEAQNQEAEAHNREAEAQNGEAEVQNGELEAQSDEGETSEAPIAKPSPPGPNVDPDVGQNMTASMRKSHRSVMKKMFPGGHAKARKQEDKTRAHLGDLPKTPGAREARKRPDIVDDALLDAGLNGHTVPDDLEYHLQVAAASNQIQELETEDPDVETSNDPSTQPDVRDPAPNSAPWNAESWGFQAVGQPNDDIEHANAERVDVEMVDAERADVEIASRSRSNSPPGPQSEGRPESEAEAESEEASRSKSVSAANSARSSPEVGRRPARFLSHSPTPDKSGSDDESETSRSRSQSRIASPKLVNGDKDSESDESSDSSDDASDAIEDEDEGEDGEKALTSGRVADPPSSPPETTPQPVTLVPATQSSQLRHLSQPNGRMSPIPNTPLASATQPTPKASTMGPLRSRLIRGRSAYTGFPTVGEQLASVKKDSVAKPEIKKFDPKTHSLGNLKKGKRNPFSGSGTSDDESSSSSEEEDGKGERAALCSVA